MRTNGIGIAVASVLCGTLALAPARADACGGFFCSNQPVDQTGERIVFTHDEQQNLVTYVQIQYQGAAESFAWVLPVPGIPTVSVGTDALFTALDLATAPSYGVNWNWNDACGYGPPMADGDASGGAGGAGGSGGRNEGGVEVIDRRQVGPYDQTTLAASDPDALVQWLADNDYDLSPRGEELLRLYVDDEHYFVAIKLVPTAGVGDIVPLVLRYAEPLPCVPIRLTAVAAQDDMPITAYVLAGSRAVPLNYYHVQLNEARIDWMGGGANYRDLVSEAVDLAPNRQAFVTEYAGSTDFLRGLLYSEGRYDLDALRTVTDPVDYVNALIGMGFRGTAQLLAFLQQWIPMPQALRDQGVDETSFYNCMDCYEGARQIPFDPVAATADLDATIVTPLREAQELLDSQPYLTRLFTTLSPDEMTTDPFFTYNLDLGDVSNVHVAQGYFECVEGQDPWTAPVRLVLPDGTELYYPEGQAGRFGGDVGPAEDVGLGAAQAGPAAKLVERTSDSGPAEVIEDNRGEIAGALFDSGRTKEAQPADVQGATAGGGGCGCGAAGAGELSLLALLAAAWATSRRRRGAAPGSSPASR